MKKRILGIDPGTLVTGFGIIEEDGSKTTALDYGCIKPPTKLKLTKRYLIIYDDIEFLLEKYHPDAVAIETQYVSKNIQSSIKLGMARGVAILAATKKGIPVFEYTPTQAKKAVCHGRASKKQVQTMVQHLLSLNSKSIPEDAADALSLAICHAHFQEIGDINVRIL